MKSTTVNINGKSEEIIYEIEETDKGKHFKVTNIPIHLNTGSEFEFGVWESNNIFQIPILEDLKNDQNKKKIIEAVLNAEGIDYNL